MVQSKKKKKKSSSSKYWNWFTKQAVIIGTVGVIIVALLFFTLKFITRHNVELEVPSLVGLSIPEAQKLAEAHSMRLEVTDSTYVARFNRGAIFKQKPEAGSFVKKNRRILLTINAIAPKEVNMPSLVGFSLRQAQSILVSNQLKIGKLIYVEDLATNNVLGQLHNGRTIKSNTPIQIGSLIDLKLGLNPDEKETMIPILNGISYKYAQETINDYSLNIGNMIFDKSVKTYSDTLESIVYKQSPDTLGGIKSIPKGSRINVYLTKDKSLIKNNSKK